MKAYGLPPAKKSLGLGWAGVKGSETLVLQTVFRLASAWWALSVRARVFTETLANINGYTPSGPKHFWRHPPYRDQCAGSDSINNSEHVEVKFAGMVLKKPV
jgi:hypothetical protein